MTTSAQILQRHDHIILFDGVCNFCDSSLQRVLKYDSNKKFVFASLQSNVGQSLLQYFDLPLQNFDSFVLIDHGQLYTKSTAALRVARELSWPLKAVGMFYIAPRFIRDFVYQLIAKNRYKLFGKKESCMIPTPEHRSRFIG